jgi:hypothetical protein
MQFSKPKLTRQNTEQISELSTTQFDKPKLRRQITSTDIFMSRNKSKLDLSVLSNQIGVQSKIDDNSKVTSRLERYVEYYIYEILATSDDKFIKKFCSMYNVSNKTILVTKHHENGVIDIIKTYEVTGIREDNENNETKIESARSLQKMQNHLNKLHQEHLNESGENANPENLMHIESQTQRDAYSFLPMGKNPGGSFTCKITVEYIHMIFRWTPVSVKGV